MVAAPEALALAAVSGIAFLAAAATLGFWPAVLAPPVLLVLLGYSYAKRFTWLAHAWLGVAARSPPAARGSPWGRDRPSASCS